MMRPARVLWLALACAPPACGLAQDAASAARAAAAAAPARPVVHYRTAGGVFSAPHASWDADNQAPRQVEWRYPVFTDTSDRATVKLNAWIGRESLKLLLGDDEAADAAMRLDDPQVMAFAARQPVFIESELDQAEIQVALALGIYRTFTFYSEVEGIAHPAHIVTPHLYDLRRGEERRVQDLFADDDDGELPDLYDQQNKSDAHPCEQYGFDWRNAALGGRDALHFEYPYQPGWDVECENASVIGPQVARLLKSPRDLEPIYDVLPAQRQDSRGTTPPVRRM